MELLHEFLLSAFFAALLSFVVSKLVDAFFGRDDARKDSRFNVSGVVGEDRGLKVEGFEGEKRVEAVKHAVVEKVNEFDGEKNSFQLEGALELAVSGSGLPEKLAERGGLNIGLPGKSSAESPGEQEVKGHDHKQVLSVGKDKDGCCVEENISSEFSAEEEEKEKIEMKRDCVIDYVVEDGEFSAKDDELKRDVVDDEVIHGELNTENDELRRDVIDEMVKDVELGDEKNDVTNDRVNSDGKDDAKRDSTIHEVKDGEFSAGSGELKRDFIEDEVKDGEFTTQNEGMKDEGNSEVKDDEVRFGEINVKGVSTEMLSSGDVDDDWEGIEITEMEKIFAEATRYVASKENFERVSSFGSDVLMELDALHEVVAQGPCLEPQPMALNLSARAKWNARQKLGDMDPDTALEQYVALLSQKAPDWMEETSENIKSERATGAVSESLDSSLSTNPHHQPLSTVGRPLEPDSDLKEGNERTINDRSCSTPRSP